jgi:HlyD family secretion protein
MLKKRYFWWGLLILIVIIAGAFWWYKAKSTTTKTQYTSATAQKGTIVSAVTASGSVTSSNYYNVTTQASGVVQSVAVKDGDQVTAGQELLSINLDQAGQQAQEKADASYLSAQTALQDAQNNKVILQNGVDQNQLTANQSKLNAQKALLAAKESLRSATTTRNRLAAQDAIKIAQQNYDAAGTSADQSQTNLQSAQNKLADADTSIAQAQANLQAASNAYQETKSIVTAAVSGQISGLSVFPGMSVTVSSGSNSNSNSTSSTLLSITNQTNPIISVNVSESDIANIKIGQSASITLDAFTGDTFTGKVVGINKDGTVSSGVTNYPVMIQFDTLPDNVLPNMSATANIILQTATDVLTVPSAAIQTATDGTNTIQILVSGVPQTKTVQVGISDDTNTQITSGINAGDVVVTGTVAATTATASSSTTSIFGGLRTGAAGGGFSGGGATRTGGSSSSARSGG